MYGAHLVGVIINDPSRDHGTGISDGYLFLQLPPESSGKDPGLGIVVLGIDVSADTQGKQAVEPALSAFVQPAGGKNRPVCPP